MLQTQPLVRANGALIPALGLGTWLLHGPGCSDVVEEALHRGYRHLDTAQTYDNEDRVGEALQRAHVEREEVFLTTKVWFDNYPKERFHRSVDESLKKLKTDYVDLLLLHWPRFSGLEMERVLDSLMTVRESGKARHIGVSNFTARQVERAQLHTKGGLVANQVEYHPLLNQSGLLAKLQDHEMALIAYSPLARGKILSHDVVREIALSHQADPAQVVLAWLLAQPRVAAVPKASTADHLRTNLVALELKLSNEEMARLSRLGTERCRQVSHDLTP